MSWSESQKEAIREQLKEFFYEIQTLRPLDMGWKENAEQYADKAMEAITKGEEQ